MHVHSTVYRVFYYRIYELWYFVSQKVGIVNLMFFNNSHGSIKFFFINKYKRFNVILKGWLFIRYFFKFEKKPFYKVYFSQNICGPTVYLSICRLNDTKYFFLNVLRKILIN